MRISGFAEGVAQVFNLWYRRFPIGKAFRISGAYESPKARRLEVLRYSRSETRATSDAALPKEAQTVRMARMICPALDLGAFLSIFEA